MCLAGLLPAAACNAANDLDVEPSATSELQFSYEISQQSEKSASTSTEIQRTANTTRNEGRYPLGSTARRMYLLESGNVAPPGAKVTFDFGPVDNSYDQESRTTLNRWPNGYPAAPGSLNYEDISYGRRERHRMDRWKIAMEESGIPDYWKHGVPDLLEPYPLEEYFGLKENEEMTTLRLYALLHEPPPRHVLWSLPRWTICGTHEHAKSSNAYSALNTLGCEPVLDWSIWVIEQLLDQQDSGRPFADQIRRTMHCQLAIEFDLLSNPPITSDDVRVIALAESTHLWVPALIASTWLNPGDDTGSADAFVSDRLSIIDYFAAEVEHGNAPLTPLSCSTG